MASGSNDRMKYSKVGTTWFFSLLFFKQDNLRASCMKKKDRKLLQSVYKNVYVLTKPEYPTQNCRQQQLPSKPGYELWRPKMIIKTGEEPRLQKLFRS